MEQITKRNFTFKAFWVLAIISIVGTLQSCQKEVHIKLNSAPSQLVVEGGIQTGTPPIVLLTSSVSFFSSIDLSSLQDIFVHNAIVKVSDGTDTVTLKELSFDTGSSGSKFYVYTLDPGSSLMLGQVNKFYTLTIEYNGQTYTSVTKIPTPKAVDTMWIDSPLFSSPRIPKGALQLFVTYSDPDTPGNYVRYFTKRNSEQYFASDNVYTDQLINGQTVPKIELFAGYNKTQDANGDSLSYFYPGDTVTLNWSMIDKGVFDFWNTLNFAEQSTGNPFASPINVKSNIKGGALGVWAGYGSITRTLIIPK